MKWFLGIAGAIAVVGLMGTTAHAACAQTNVLYKAAFNARDDSWTTTEGDTTTMKMSDGVVMFEKKAGGSESAFYNGDTFGSATICTDIALTAQSDKNASAGVVFWSGEGANYYIFQIDPVLGTFAVQRRKDAKWLFPLDWKASEAVKRGVNAVNELSVTTDGAHMTASINGQEVASLIGAPGDGPWKVGLHFEGGDTVSATWSATNFTVTR